MVVRKESYFADDHDPNFQYGSTQAVVALLLLWFSLFSKYLVFSAIRAFSQNLGVTQHVQHRLYSHNFYPSDESNPRAKQTKKHP